ncbi:MAG: acetyl-CoA hydrolase/transferase family protein [Lewinellaceae bacterium]|nr:acetyl-CoA hydrolase/transferase family protein [Lewinellaceae bacterium]
MKKFVSPAEAVAAIQSDNRVFIHTAAANPHSLVQAMVDDADSLNNVEVIHLHTEGPAPYTNPEYKGKFFTNSMFIGANVRDAVPTDRADYIPVFLSETPFLFRRGMLPLDVAMLTVSPPDHNGWCSLGVSVDCSLAAAQTAKFVIAEINPNMPRTHGDSFIHISKFHAIVESDRPIPEVHAAQPTPEESKIGKYISELVEDGATLQMGIGSIPNAVLAALGNHKKLGIHTEMFTDGIIDLVEKGVITGEMKHRQRGEITATFLFGTKRLYDFVHDNPMIRMMEASYTNDTAIIRKNQKATAINSAIEIDLTGQVCADSIGKRMYSGVGGQMDFIRGASLSEGGKPIIALTSTTAKGQSKIVPFLKQGAGVVTTRAHVHYVVTEYGVVNLHGKNLEQRSKALIGIAHPDFREELSRQAHDIWAKE